MKRQYRDIQHTLRKSDRKTTSINIERDGEISVLVPDLTDFCSGKKQG